MPLDGLYVVDDVVAGISRHQMKRGLVNERIPLFDNLIFLANILRNISLTNPSINSQMHFFNLLNYSNSMINNN